MTDSGLRALTPHAIGTPLARVDGPAKVTGTAPYAYEHPVAAPAYAHALQAPIARGLIVAVDTAAAEAEPGVLAVLTHLNAGRLRDAGDAELAVLQSAGIAFRGQLVGAVIAETPEAARHAASLVDITYEEYAHDTELRLDDPNLYAPDHVNPAFDTDTEQGDFEAGLASADVIVDEVYRTPMQHNNPMEPHATTAIWRESAGGEGPRLTLYDSTQGAHKVRETLAPVLGVEEDEIRVIAPYVGGGFGSKGTPHAHNVLAVLAAQLTGGRPVKLPLTRQQLFAVAGHRTPTVQRVRLGARRDGRLLALCHDAVAHTARIKEFAEQTAVVSRMMYKAPHRRTTHRLAALDVPIPFWMRAPGEAPGMYAVEVALDELAHACGIDPIELRVRNDPETDPETGKPWSGRHLVECLRTGAQRFGWDRRNATGSRRDGEWLVGMGVAGAVYPAYGGPGTAAEVEYLGKQRYAVRTAAADIGTGAWTVLTQIAADALGVPTDSVRMEIGDTALPHALVAGGSSGTNNWGSAVVAAARAFRDRFGQDPAPGSRQCAEPPDNPGTDRFAVHSFGAHFAEVKVHADTGEIRVPRMLGVFSVGRVINPRTARSQLIGGMTWGLSMALHEQSVLDHRTGHVVNHDLAEYHFASCADVQNLEAVWLDEEDPHSNPMGSRGVGEIGIVGSPAAIVNAVHNATGIRVRDLPVTADKLLRD
jgi:xanthine dehydrogenase YagR molybdenum-binding subunit